eukprot:6155585-Pleurochrysis_carterae.AAC.1
MEKMKQAAQVDVTFAHPGHEHGVVQGRHAAASARKLEKVLRHTLHQHADGMIIVVEFRDSEVARALKLTDRV